MRAYARFKVVRFTEGGLTLDKAHGALRLSCLTDEGVQLVIWCVEGGNPSNINRAVKQKPPFFVECFVWEPDVIDEMAGDDYWVDEEEPLEVTACRRWI